MNRTRALQAFAGSVVVVVLGGFVVSALGNETPARAASTQTSTAAQPVRHVVVDGTYRGYLRDFAEPEGKAIADGTYVGFVRDDGRHDGMVLVDFTSLKEGILADDHPAVRVDAGPIANARFFGPVWQPFRLTIESQTIVSALSADDVLPAPTRSEASRPMADDAP